MTQINTTIDVDNNFISEKEIWQAAGIISLIIKRLWEKGKLDRRISRLSDDKCRRTQYIIEN